MNRLSRTSPGPQTGRDLRILGLGPLPSQRAAGQIWGILGRWTTRQPDAARLGAAADSPAGLGDPPLALSRPSGPDLPRVPAPPSPSCTGGLGPPSSRASPPGRRRARAVRTGVRACHRTPSRRVRHPTLSTGTRPASLNRPATVRTPRFRDPVTHCSVLELGRLRPVTV